MKQSSIIAVLLAAALCACGKETPAQNETAQIDAGAGQFASAPAGQLERRTAPQPAAALPPGVFEARKLEIMDPSGFERPLVAASLLAPMGWALNGGIVWGPLGMCGPDYAANMALQSPDGSQALRILPAANWSDTRSVYPIDPQANSQCEKASYLSVRDYLQGAAQRMFPGGRVIDFRPLPEETKPMQDMIAQLPPLPPSDTMDAKMFYDGGEVLVAYQENGRDMRAAVSAVALITQTRLFDMMNPGQIAMEQIAGFPTQITVVSAPNGSLDLNLRRRVMKTVRYMPEWMQKTQAYWARKAEINAKAARDRSDNWMEASKAQHEARMGAIKKQGEIINGMYDDRQLTSDHNQREFIESIRGVETYNDPVAGSPVQLDNTYDQAWRLKNDDVYLMTNDVNFDPNRYGLDAQKLEVAK